MYGNPYQYSSQQYHNFIPQQVAQPNMSNITWVQGEAGAKAYPVGAGTSALLMDSESENFYIKCTDASGMPQPLRKFEYKEKFDNAPSEVPPVAQTFDSSQFVTREEFEKRLNDLNKRRTTLTHKEEEKDGNKLI